MARASEVVSERTDRLDAAGNTTKALTKGYAVASAALAAFLLFSAYLDRVKQLKGIPADTPFPVDLSKVEVFLGGLLGAMLVYFFSSLAIRAVGRAGAAIIEEVRTQFRAHPWIMAGTEKRGLPPRRRHHHSVGASEHDRPGLLAVLFPIGVGLILKAEAAAAMLMVGTMAGVILATVLNTAARVGQREEVHSS